mmetsp:Transcript_29827/g.67600  ORF Transcript_29827/g.67600 Transcript_29827/m.67600 type:complete len:307 (+) Transcript_29827:179-1099(+)
MSSFSQIDEARLQRVEMAGLLCWLLKDAGWALLLPKVSWPAAALALILEIFSLSCRWRAQTGTQRVHGTATFLWLLGNAVWMTGEFLHAPEDKAGVQLPWHSGPVLAANDHLYMRWVRTARGIFIAAMAELLLHYIGSICSHRKDETDYPACLEPTPRAPPQLVMGLFTLEAYEGAFIGPWIAKDICWTFSLFWASLPFALVVVALMLDYINIARTGILFQIIELWWVMANIVWLSAELALHDEYLWPRITAGVILLLGSIVAVFAFWHVKPEKSRVSEVQPSEGSYLFGGSASARTARPAQDLAA